jgi:hypothetical protein
VEALYYCTFFKQQKKTSQGMAFALRHNLVSSLPVRVGTSTSPFDHEVNKTLFRFGPLASQLKSVAIVDFSGDKKNDVFPASGPVAPGPCNIAGANDA